VSRKAAALAAALATSGYFALAYYFAVSHTPDVPRRDDVAVIPRILRTGTPGTFYAHLWLPNHVKSAIVYENGISIGGANAVYDDPNRTMTRDGKRWKYVEFNTKGGEHARRWIVFPLR
jgi:hypothetical protein